MNAIHIARHHDENPSGPTAGVAQPLLGRKSVLMGMAGSMGVAIASAAQSPAAVAAGTGTYIPQWAPSTAYMLGQQVVSPNNDVVSAKVGHTSSTAFATDVPKWKVSSTFGLKHAIDAADYGWSSGATAAVNETAFRNAYAAAKTAHQPLYLGPGTYQKTNGLDLRATSTDASGIRLFGAGGTLIVVNTDTAELLQVGGFGHYLSDFAIQHANWTPTATTGDGLVFYKAAYCTFKRLNIQSAGNLLTIAQVDVLEPGAGTGAGNWMFSCTFEDLGLHRYSKSGISLRGVKGASTGSMFTNIYLQNGSPGSPLASTGLPVDLFLCDEMVFNQLNIEDHAGVGIAILLNQSTAVFNAVHFERIPLTGWHPQYIRAYGVSQITINQMTLAFCNVGNSGASEWSALFTVGLGGVIDARGIWIHDCTKTGSAAWRLVESGDTDARNAVTVSQPVVKDGSPAFTALTTSTYTGGIKRIGDTSYLPATGTAYAILDGRSAASAAVTTPVVGYTDVTVPLAHVVKNSGMGVSAADTIKCVIAGVYIANASVQFGGGAAGPPVASIIVNGVAVVQCSALAIGAGRVSGGGLVTLNVGDLVTLHVYSTATTTTIAGGSNQADIQLSLARIGS